MNIAKQKDEISDKTEIVDWAYAAGKSATSRLSENEQKRLGQFMTPHRIALVMAQVAVKDIQSDVVRILEPAAGAGILAAAAVVTLISRKNPPSRIELTLCEMDDRLAPALRKLSNVLRRTADQKGISLAASVKIGDFLLSDIATIPKRKYDLIIANPPYFKICKASDQAVAHNYAVYGQPNIYGLFMAATGRLLAAEGKCCFITPRSWTNGHYFSSVRRHLLSNIRIDAIHVFESRQEHFSEDEILQETVITWGTASRRQYSNIVISTSNGVGDISDAKVRIHPAGKIINADHTIVLPMNDADCTLPGCETLESLGLKVSTGPVVAFRAEPYISKNKRHKSVPLLWMQHISRMTVSWPIGKKREHIDMYEATKAMLVPNATMVLLRRFSPKEDVRRVTAAAYLGKLKTSHLGLENHLNYIYRPDGELLPMEAIGIAAYLNSRLVDNYLRSVAGSTQINARELRKLPMPTNKQLSEIGRLCQNGISLAELDSVVESVMGIVQQQ